MLSVRGVRSGYGDAVVVDDVDLDVESGKIVTIVGPNGAGKSTVARTIAGLLPARSGSIRLHDVDLTKTGAEARVAVGIALVPESRALFTDLTVRDNLLLGAFRRRRQGRRKRLEAVEEVFPLLGRRASQKAGSLSGGEQQMLAIGRALMSEPEVLILDEPSLGLAPLIVGSILDQLRTFAADGMGVLLIEQNAVKALAISDTAIVLEHGSVVLNAPAADIGNDPRLAAAYLGEVV